MEREIFGVFIADELADVRPERSRCGCTSGDSNSWDWISGNSPVRPDNVSYGGDRDRGEGRGLESAVQLVSAVSTPPKEDRVMLVGRKENLSRIRERNKGKKSGRQIKRGWQIEKTVEVEVIERLRREGTSLKSIVSTNCYWQSYIPSPLSHPFSYPFIPNTFCQHGLSVRASHNTANFAVDGSVAVADVVVAKLGRGAAGTAGTASFASAKPPPTCPSSLEIASIPVFRALPPESVTNSCNHAARCTSTMEICSPARENRSA